MATRLISAKASEIMKMSKEELLASIKASEGRVVCSECQVLNKPAGDELTFAEIDVAFGADLILLNFLDVFNPKIVGVNESDEVDEEIVRKLKKLLGRPIGINLEPVNLDVDLMEARDVIVSGRTATEAAFKKANELGVDFICLTGNPKTGVDNATIAEAIKVANKHYDGLIVAGKMHSAGVDEAIIDAETVTKFSEAGADIILLPSYGSVPGVDELMIKECCQIAHKNNVLTMSAIGTSQECSSKATIEQMALVNKVCGVDIQHIGGFSRPENIMAMAIAIRGERHTYNRMAQSINR